jgi:hypothetical protein
MGGTFICISLEKRNTNKSMTREERKEKEKGSNVFVLYLFYENDLSRTVLLSTKDGCYWFKRS